VDAKNAGIPVEEYIATRISPHQLLESLSAATDRLNTDFGTWKKPWGEINRYQRLTADIVQPFNDAGQAFQSDLRPRFGARLPRSAPVPIKERKSGMAPAATASSP
jgi:hypothetical protein